MAAKHSNLLKVQVLISRFSLKALKFHHVAMLHLLMFVSCPFEQPGAFPSTVENCFYFVTAISGCEGGESVEICQRSKLERQFVPPKEIMLEEHMAEMERRANINASSSFRFHLITCQRLTVF